MGARRLQGGTRLWARPATMAGGLGAAYLAEALLNAPQVLGSLDLLLNPTGAQHHLLTMVARPLQSAFWHGCPPSHTAPQPQCLSKCAY